MLANIQKVKGYNAFCMECYREIFKSWNEHRMDYNKMKEMTALQKGVVALKTDTGFMCLECAEKVFKEIYQKIKEYRRSKTTKDHYQIP